MAFFKTIRDVLSKTRAVFSKSLHFLSGKTTLDAETLEALETLLLKADFGIETADKILTQVKRRVEREKTEVLPILKAELSALLDARQKSFQLSRHDRPTLILMLGVNGAGKTTTIGKLAYFLKAQGFSIVLAAGDTFRAAAIAQLQTWAERNQVPLIAQKQGSDSASVIFDALQSAYSKKTDIVIADTAGRLQNKSQLMEELKKIARVLKKLDSEAPHEVILVLDASIGQNALSQVKEFNEAIPLTGLVLTKLDGTAKGGIVFAIANQYSIPLYFLGTGEALEDFRPFDTTEFIDGLFDNSIAFSQKPI